MKHNQKTIILCHTKLASRIKNTGNEFTLSIDELNDQEQVNINLAKREIYEFPLTTKEYIKPHFEIDYPWDKVDQSVVDELVLNAWTFIITHFDCDVSDICVLYDEKPNKCSLHFNLSNTYTTMKELVQWKRKNISEMKLHHFDAAIYRMGQNKWRMPFACKVNDRGVPIGTGLIPVEYPDLGIYIHEIKDYMISHTTPDMYEWNYVSTDPPVETGGSVSSLESDPKGNYKITDKIKDSTDKIKDSMYNKLVELILNNRRSAVHTHAHITCSAKELYILGYPKLAQRLIFGCMNTKGNDLTNAWIDCQRNAFTSNIEIDGFMKLAKMANENDYYIITRENLFV